MHSPKIIVVVAVALVVCAGVVYRYGRPGAEAPPQCPPTTLLCPDGTLLGPQGKACTLGVCPAVGPLTGVLRQVGGGYQLVLAAPTTTTQEVSYALPLSVADAQKLAPLVGKRVVVQGSFAAENTYRVDSITLTPNPDPTLGQVRVGQSVFINGVRITLLKVTNDSRCPVGVQCIRAGSVTAQVAFTSDTDSATTTIESGAQPFGFDAFLISLVGVEPPRKAGSAPAQSAYMLTLRVADTTRAR